MNIFNAKCRNTKRRLVIHEFPRISLPRRQHSGDRYNCSKEAIYCAASFAKDPYVDFELSPEDVKITERSESQETTRFGRSRL